MFYNLYFISWKNEVGRICKPSNKITKASSRKIVFVLMIQSSAKTYYYFCYFFRYWYFRVVCV
jgi:hypothetical protein